jgi:hypothetical protein
LALQGCKIHVARNPAGLGSEWVEDFIVTGVNDVYKHPIHGRTIEFWTSDKQSRTVAINRISFPQTTQKKLRQRGFYDA